MKNIVKSIQKGIYLIIRSLVILLALLLPFVAMLTTEGLDWLFSTWSDLSMDEIVYQLKTPMQGTNPDMIIDFISTCIPPAIIVLLLSGLIIGMSKNSRIFKWIVPMLTIIVSVNIGVTSVQAAWNELDVDQYIEDTTTSSYFIEDNYANPNEVQIQFPEQKRNLIYIFLESMEATYSSKEYGGAFDDNYIPELTALAYQNTSFSYTDSFGGIFSPTGSTWTMGAMVAQTSGLPLRLNLRAGNITEDIDILPRATTLGDILEQQGYRQVIMFGSDGTFAGRDQYFQEHGNYEVMDYQYAVDHNWIPEDYRVWWGYEDSKLFEFAKQQVTELAAGSQPFNLTLLTVDTHFEDGYTCSLCQNTYGNQYADVMACSSHQVAEFVNWVQQQPFYENTTIVLVGDHLTMDTDFCENIDADYQRSVYNVFINSAVSATNSKTRCATTLDMFPTTLASLGVTIEGEKLGLGTNLFSDVSTLAEKTSLEEMDEEFRKKSIFYEVLAGNQDVNTEVFDMH